jgi:transcription elongation factor Elf1
VNCLIKLNGKKKECKKTPTKKETSSFTFKFILLNKKLLIVHFVIVKLNIIIKDEKSVDCKLDFKEKIGKLKCRICNSEFESAINHLSVGYLFF